MRIGEYIRKKTYGDPRRRDFSERDIPVNRTQLFGTVFGVRLRSLIGLNVIYILIWIPAALWFGFNLAGMLRVETVKDLYEIFVWLMLGLFPFTAITGPCNMGASYVCRNWARDQHAYVWSDFKTGLKENLKKGFLYSAVSGFVYAMTGSAVIYYAQSTSRSTLFYVPLILTFLVMVMWSLMELLIPTIIVTYDLKVREIFKDALILTILEMPRAFLIRLTTMLVPLLMIILSTLAPRSMLTIIGIGVTFEILIITAFNKLLTASYANMVCEKHMNIKIEGAATDIGLRSMKETHIGEEE